MRHKQKYIAMVCAEEPFWIVGAQTSSSKKEALSVTNKMIELAKKDVKWTKVFLGYVAELVKTASKK